MVSSDNFEKNNTVMFVGASTINNPVKEELPLICRINGI
ncbi:hypothetical protein SBF1_990026 [Candidatus Desulfosporosinus infrequens]|uniref:Uncharacterized protein n=1 Tax=Candidatus Desulfosporosinus infrequens TaxID=2043169 RepID=A0A2U3LYW4_9FIRM|nr:hypothetical protein SBF1_990026 [Candidatus Desulfosporosinus infrequens]